ncbi:MAG: hypothetical protein M3N98_11115 [Actinomycetota bacterium]|nr:hypothetical protein [Actinomycetota bacterium]
MTSRSTPTEPIQPMPVAPAVAEAAVGISIAGLGTLVCAPLVIRLVGPRADLAQRAGAVGACLVGSTPAARARLSERPAAVMAQ